MVVAAASRTAGPTRAETGERDHVDVRVTEEGRAGNDAGADHDVDDAARHTRSRPPFPRT